MTIAERVEALRQLVQDRDDLLDALTKLANEASGFLYLASHGRTAGHTNRTILQLRINEARAAIAKMSEDVS